MKLVLTYESDPRHYSVYSLESALDLWAFVAKYAKNNPIEMRHIGGAVIHNVHVHDEEPKTNVRTKKRQTSKVGS